MKHSIYPSLRPQGLLMIMTFTLGAVLVGCSAASDNDAETLAQTSSNTFAPTLPESDFEPNESRSSGAWGGVYMTEAELRDDERRIVSFADIVNYADDDELTELKIKFGDENAYVGNDGSKIYHDSCAGCHMHQGQGAQGAGYYPPLANNPKMESKFYTLDILINGFRGMPSFRSLLNDEQMAAVTQYVMNDLNSYRAEVTAADAAQLRPSSPPQNEAVH